MNAFITLNNELLLDLESFGLIKDTYKNVVKHNDQLKYESKIDSNKVVIEEFNVNVEKK